MPDSPTLERRAYPFALRAALDGEDSRIVGHAAVFNADSLPLGDGWGETFIERIAPGAFRDSLKTDDIRALFNHDANFVLGRNRSSTLALSEDERGLAVDIDTPETNWARDLMRSMRRGDIDQMSFAFNVEKDDWVYDKKADTVTRTLLAVRLFDVSVVTYPAYPQTDASVRSYLHERAAALRTPPPSEPVIPLALYRRRLDLEAMAQGGYL